MHQPEMDLPSYAVFLATQKYLGVHTSTKPKFIRIMEKSTCINYDFLHFPFSNFRYSLTLFSKFFASFPHGTCSLSVSHRYLALDGIYHPLWAAIPSNPTRIKHFYSKVRRGCHPLCRPIPRDSDFVREINKCKKKAQFGAEQISPYADSQDELFPLHSPLLGESWLVSFPRFNDMLKFNRYSYFIWDPKTNERTNPTSAWNIHKNVSTVVPARVLK